MSRLLDRVTFAPVADGGGFEVAECDFGGQVFYLFRNAREGVPAQAARPGTEGLAVAPVSNAFHADGWAWFSWAEWDEEWGGICESGPLRDAMKWGER